MDVRSSSTFTWDAVAGAVDYQVELSQLSGVVDKVATVTSTSIIAGDLFTGVTGLGVGSQRRVRVRARDVLNVPGDWSTFLTVTIVGLPAPTNLNVIF